MKYIVPSGAKLSAMNAVQILLIQSLYLNVHYSPKKCHETLNDAIIKISQCLAIECGCSYSIKSMGKLTHEFWTIIIIFNITVGHCWHFSYFQEFNSMLIS